MYLRKARLQLVDMNKQLSKVLIKESLRFGDKNRKKRGFDLFFAWHVATRLVS